MKVKLTQNARVLVQAGTEIELEDSQAALLVMTGHAVPVKERSVERAVKQPAEKKTTKK